MPSQQVVESLLFLNIYGATFLEFLMLLITMHLVRKLLRLPARVDLYFSIVTLLCGTLPDIMRPHFQNLIGKVTTAVEPDFYELPYRKSL